MKINDVILKYLPFIKEIIAKLAYECDSDNLEDLVNDVVIVLYDQKDKVLELEAKNELKYFIVAVVTNNLRSVNSPYYRTYKKLKLNSVPLNYESDENDD